MCFNESKKKIQRQTFDSVRQWRKRFSLSLHQESDTKQKGDSIVLPSSVIHFLSSHDSSVPWVPLPMYKVWWCLFIWCMSLCDIGY